MERKTLDEIIERRETEAYNNALEYLATTVVRAEKLLDDTLKKAGELNYSIQELHDAEGDEVNDIYAIINEFNKKFNTVTIHDGSISAAKIVAGSITAKHSIV